MSVRHAGKRCVVAAAVLGMVLGWGGVSDFAIAALITFNFEGNVTSVSPSVSSFFSTSDKLVGSYTFDSNAPDLSPSIQFGGYVVNQLSFTLGQNAYSAQTPHISIISNSALGPHPGQSADSYSVSSNSNTGPSAGLLLPTSFGFSISGMNKFPNDSLPLTPPSLANLVSTDRAFSMGFVQPVGAVGNVNGVLTSLTLAPVPLPGAVVLFGSGLVGLVAIGRRHLIKQS
jgi:hypothetical protein